MIRPIVGLGSVALLSAAVHSLLAASPSSCSRHKPAVVLIKVGGSSITDKAVQETLNEPALEWFAKTIHEACCSSQDEKQQSFVIVHGAGSFGHHTAKSYGLRGQTEPPPPRIENNCSSSSSSSHSPFEGDDDADDERRSRQRRMMQGLSETRASVQKLNHAVVSALVQVGVRAVGISPCFGVPGIQAHGGVDAEAQRQLQDTVFAAVAAGLVPVLHGDACLYGDSGAGILSGDTVMEMLGQADWVSHAIFLTDVDGVFSADPNTDPESAVLLPRLTVDPITKEIAIDNDELQRLEATAVTGSTHAHDVTGGLQTKLQSAASIAATGKNVTIVRCTSPSARQAILRRQLDGGETMERATVLVPLVDTCDNDDDDVVDIK